MQTVNVTYRHSDNSDLPSVCHFLLKTIYFIDVRCINSCTLFCTSSIAVSPRGEAVSVGGADSSVGLAQVTTEWPDTWSRLRSGAYRAEVDVSLAALSGSGTWTVFLMNAWSLSERVEYDLSIGFRFQGRPDYKTGGSCSPSASPTPVETSAPTVSMAPTSAPTPGMMLLACV